MYFGQIEGTGFEALDPSFKAAFNRSVRIERLWTGARWLEGPCYFPAHGSLIFSDIPNNRMMRYNEQDGSVGVFRQPSNNANGNTRDREGRLLTCEHLTRRVTRTEHNGEITVLAAHYNGKRLNSPNDIVVKSDGSIWFTDPDFGILTDYEGLTQEAEQDLCGVYRIDGLSGKITRVADMFEKPNGLAFSPDEKHLYIVESGTKNTKDNQRNITRFEVQGETLQKPQLFANFHGNAYDGIRFDRQNRLWASSSEGIQCLNSEGVMVGKILIPEIVSNICFGGFSRNRLFICGTSSLYSVYINAFGCNL